MIRGIGFIKVKYRVVDNEYFCRDYEGAEAAEEAAERLIEDKLAEGVDLESVALADLEDFYRQAKKRFDDEAGFADKSRDYVVKLQSGDAHCQKLWQLFIDTSVKHSNEVYQKLNVTLTDADINTIS